MKKKKLALIHTSMVFLKAETMMSQIFVEVMPEVELINIVDDSLLPDVMKVGTVTPPVERRMALYLQAAEETGADAIFSLCSSLGPAVDKAKAGVRVPVIKIDDAMTERAVRTARRIGVIATVGTTLGPTVNLILEKARDAGAEVEVKQVLVNGAFELLMAGKKEEHDEAVCRAAEEVAKSVETVVFAQASMTRLAPRVEELTHRPVLTSPRLGIEYVKQVLDSLDRDSTAGAPEAPRQRVR